MDPTEMEYANLSKNSEILLGLISDTHLLSGNTVPPEIDKIFRGVDLILHAGDMYGTSVLDRLEQIAPVLAVRGDEDFFTQPDSRVKEEHFFDVGGLTLWLVHQLPLDCIRLLAVGSESEMLEQVSRRCQMVPDIIVFGDTHRHLVKSIGDILFINPGSPTLPDHMPGAGTVALLSVAAGRSEVRLVGLELEVD
ncbi:metallophosphoesterase family protein [Chloroflexota bacterium]